MASARSDPPRSVDEYMRAVAPEFRPALERLRRQIRAAAPRAEEVISYRIPTFRQDGMLVSFAAFKDHCSFFGLGDFSRSQYATEMAPFRTGKGTLSFTPERPLPASLVRKIVKARLKENAARRAKRRK